MALERHSIEKKDFPIGRRGYDPEAVDTHLSGLADEIEELKANSRKRTETLASSASERVRAIVDAAETSAADIQRQAEEEAQEIRSDARSEAKSTRDGAVAQARDYVGKVSESTTGMLQRLDAMESELGALVEALRTGANRLNADLQLLEGNLTEVGDAVTPRPRFEPEPERAAEPAPTAAAETSSAAQAAPEPSEPSTEAGDKAEPASEAPAGNASAGDDTEGARLIALNMALNGTSREETDKYLEENFKIGDRQQLLDEVYASVEG